MPVGNRRNKMDHWHSNADTFSGELVCVCLNQTAVQMWRIKFKIEKMSNCGKLKLADFAILTKFITKKEEMDLCKLIYMYRCKSGNHLYTIMRNKTYFPILGKR